MGHGTAPADIDLDTAAPIDGGTSARIDSPTPGPVGLDAKSGDAKQSGAGIADQIVGYARRQRGSRVGNGQCFDLADTRAARRGRQERRRLRQGHAERRLHMGHVGDAGGLQPGDVIQFRDYTYERVVVTKTDKGHDDRRDRQDRPHHTAIVESVDGNGAVTVLEQNAPDEARREANGPVLQGRHDDERQSDDDDQGQGNVLVLPPPGALIAWSPTRTAVRVGRRVSPSA